VVPEGFHRIRARFARWHSVRFAAPQSLQAGRDHGQDDLRVSVGHHGDLHWRCQMLASAAFSHPLQSYSNESSVRGCVAQRGSAHIGVEYARCHCVRRPGHLPLAGRLFPPETNSLCEASTIAAALPDQSEFTETESATCQEG
jgi:hypothetical protein